jgi:hypothetical protein
VRHLGKFAGILGPAIFAVTIAATGSSRNAILSVLAFFVVGGLLLAAVDAQEGQRAARAADAETRPQFRVEGGARPASSHRRPGPDDSPRQ